MHDSVLFILPTSETQDALSTEGHRDARRLTDAETETSNDVDADRSTRDWSFNGNPSTIPLKHGIELRGFAHYGSHAEPPHQIIRQPHVRRTAHMTLNQNSHTGAE